ncbi:MAG: hypothetical protein FJX67_13815 [Alphaproteobacteria bacterium]|nr:hypothetical protein [Alphaproteobacteria bacterium]
MAVAGAQTAMPDRSGAADPAAMRAEIDALKREVEGLRGRIDALERRYSPQPSLGSDRLQPYLTPLPAPNPVLR